MNQQEDKYLDQIAEKIMKDASLESPSFNFTDAVMSRVEALEGNNAVITYKPLISKVGWFFILITLLGAIAYVLFGSNAESLGWLNGIDFSAFPSLKNVNILSGITIPKTVTYSVVLFGFMLSIQIFYIKRHLNKPFES